MGVQVKRRILLLTIVTTITLATPSTYTLATGLASLAILLYLSWRQGWLVGYTPAVILLAGSLAAAYNAWIPGELALLAAALLIIRRGQPGTLGLPAIGEATLIEPPKTRRELASRLRHNKWTIPVLVAGILSAAVLQTPQTIAAGLYSTVVALSSILRVLPARVEYRGATTRITIDTIPLVALVNWLRRRLIHYMEYTMEPSNPLVDSINATSWLVTLAGLVPPVSGILLSLGVHPLLAALPLLLIPAPVVHQILRYRAKVARHNMSVATATPVLLLLLLHYVSRGATPTEAFTMIAGDPVIRATMPEVAREAEKILGPRKTVSTRSIENYAARIKDVVYSAVWRMIAESLRTGPEHFRSTLETQSRVILDEVSIRAEKLVKSAGDWITLATSILILPVAMVGIMVIFSPATAGPVLFLVMAIVAPTIFGLVALRARQLANIFRDTPPHNWMIPALFTVVGAVVTSILDMPAPAVALGISTFWALGASIVYYVYVKPVLDSYRVMGGIVSAVLSGYRSYGSVAKALEGVAENIPEKLAAGRDLRHLAYVAGQGRARRLPATNIWMLNLLVVVLNSLFHVSRIDLRFIDIFTQFAVKMSEIRVKVAGIATGIFMPLATAGLVTLAVLVMISSQIVFFQENLSEAGSGLMQINVPLLSNITAFDPWAVLNWFTLGYLVMVLSIPIFVGYVTRKTFTYVHISVLLLLIATVVVTYYEEIIRRIIEMLGY